MDSSEKTRFIDHFYQHISEDDWADGVDLYQAGRIAELQVFPAGLITAKIRDISAKPHEVRIKLHPEASMIQWLECTCKKNRVHSRFCEHIAAIAVHIDRERPDIVQRLDLRMPVKPPSNTGKGTPPVNRDLESSDSAGAVRGKSASAVQSVIIQAGDGLHSISLLAGGPILRVRVELKPGHVSHYDLTLDEAARFLADNPQHKKASAEVAELRVYTFPAKLGIRVDPFGEESIVALKTLAIDPDKDRRLALQLKKAGRAVVGVIEIERTTKVYNQPSVKRAFLDKPSKTLHLGEAFCFVPGIGFFPLDRSGVTQGWAEAPDTQTFTGDDAARLAESSFKAIAAIATLWLEPSLVDEVVLVAPKLSSIDVIGESDGWFNLDPKYQAGNTTISMIELMRKLKKEKRKYIKTGKVWLKIPDLVANFNWQLDDTGDTLKVNALGLMRLKATLGGFDQFAGSRKILNTIRSRFEFSADAEIPDLKNTSLNLRPYQENGMKWLWWLRQNHLHGLLADEMGLGKTHQAMGLLNLVAQQKNSRWRFLVIAPTTVLDHWEDKLERFSPGLNPLKFHGPTRANLMPRVLAEHTTVITSYGVLLRDNKMLAAQKWDVVILDEAHFVKNSETATYQAACQLNTDMRVCLTGTPMENHLGELKNIFDFLLPGYLGSDDYFKRNFSQPLADGANLEVELALQKLLHPFKMRRTKHQVLPDLPAKIEDIRHCGMSEEQVGLYKNVLALKARPLLEQLSDEKSSVPYLHVFATISLLKQICDHPALVTEGADYTRHASGKFDLMKELVEEALGSGHKIVIFSQYLKMIDIIKSHLSALGVGHVSLTGQSRDRGAIIEKFQTDDSCRVFVASLLAGGIGIDLTAASVVIHYDRWWNASKENQATDRVHRIGQNKNVQVLKLVTRGTLEEKIDRLINSKRSLFEKFVDRDEEIFKNLSRQELIELLQ